MISDKARSDFIRVFWLVSGEVQLNSANHGFWNYGMNRNKGEMIALMHSKLSEALEALRNLSPDGSYLPDAHCPEFSNLEIELADTVIRIMDFSSGFKLRVGEAILAKHDFNVNRPNKHGKNF